MKKHYLVEEIIYLENGIDWCAECTHREEYLDDAEWKYDYLVSELGYKHVKLYEYMPKTDTYKDITPRLE